jgi:hypothetical protein
MVFQFSFVGLGLYICTLRNEIREKERESERGESWFMEEFSLLSQGVFEREIQER